MGANSMKKEFRRFKLKKHLIRVHSTSYRELREMLDVCDKVIVGDLEYIEDVEGITLERKPGVGGYVRVAQSWRNRKCPMRPAEEMAMLTAYKKEEDPELKNIFLGILIEYCSPSSHENDI